MPTYEYRCEKGHQFEAIQSFADDSLAECTECGAPVQRVFHAPAVHFKGSGFYTTDYGRKKTGGKDESKSSSDSSSDSGNGDSKSADGDSGGSSKPDKPDKAGGKPDKKPEPKTSG